MNLFWIACKFFFAITLLTGCLYPLLITKIATLTMPDQAYGSLVFQEGQLIGSKLIGQPFTEDRYFWPRPSSNDYNALHSQASNLGPTSQILQKQVAQRAEKFDSSHIPTDLLYSSASSVDPDISPKAAYFQLDRVAQARSLSPQDKERLHQLIAELTQSSFLAPAYLNVLQLNRRLDQQFSS